MRYNLIIIVTVVILTLSGCGEPKKGTAEYDKFFRDKLHQYVQSHPEDGEADFLYGLIVADGRESEIAWREAIFHGYNNAAINTYLGALYWGYLKKQNAPNSLEQAHYYLERAAELDPGNMVPYVLLKVLENGESNDAQKKYIKVGDLIPQQTQYVYISYYAPEISQASVCTLLRSGQLNSYNSLEVNIVAPFGDLNDKFMESTKHVIWSDKESLLNDFQKYIDALDKSLGVASRPEFSDLDTRGFTLAMIVGATNAMNKRNGSPIPQKVEALRNEVQLFKEKIKNMTDLAVSILTGNGKESDNPRWKDVLEIRKECSH
jgi:hypothetical protein